MIRFNWAKLGSIAFAIASIGIHGVGSKGNGDETHDGSRTTNTDVRPASDNNASYYGSGYGCNNDYRYFQRIRT